MFRVFIIISLSMIRNYTDCLLQLLEKPAVPEDIILRDYSTYGNRTTQFSI